jgi:5'-deoxynucleotidase YfbR-like HD superfamily hydrolase
VRKVEEILSLRASGHVKRMHTFHVHGEQTVADHCAQALNLLFGLHPNPSVALIRRLLYHDAAERHTGDIPAPIKRRVTELADAERQCEAEFYGEHPMACEGADTLTDDDRRWVKAVDTLELMLWCDDQLMMGNTHAEVIRRRVIGYLMGADTPDEVLAFMNSYPPGRSLV